MIAVVIYLGIILIVAGFVWGLGLAFARSTLTGVLALLTMPVGVILYLLLVRPNGYQRPTALMAIGIAMAVLAGFIQ